MIYGGQGLYMFDNKKENNVLMDIKDMEHMYLSPKFQEFKDVKQSMLRVYSHWY